MSDVSVDVHRGGDTVLGHVFVIAGTGLTVHRIDTGNGDALVTPGNVSVSGERIVTEGKCPQTRGHSNAILGQNHWF